MPTWAVVRCLPLPVPKSAVAVVAALGLVVGACGEIGEPDLGAVPTTATTATDETADQEVVDDLTEAEEQTIGQLIPAVPEGYVPALVLSTEEGLLVGDPAEVTSLGPPLDAFPAVRAADDFFGGLVVEQASGEVRWFPAEGGEGELINDGGGALLDVGFKDGTPEAILTAEGNAIDRVQLVTRERVPLMVLAEGRSLLDLSAGAGLFVLVYADENCGGLLFLNSGGEEVDVASPDEVSCPVPRRPAFSEVALSPAADTYVYTEVEYRSDGVEASTHLIGRELSSDTELFRIRVGEAGEQIRSVAFDGRRAAMLRSALDEETPDGLVVIDTLDPELVIPVATIAAAAVTFARLPLTVGSAAEG